MFRIKTVLLPDLIISFTNKEFYLQTKSHFENVATLYTGLVDKFLKVQPRPVLAQITEKMNEFHKEKSQNYHIDYIEPNRKDITNEVLSSSIVKLCITHSLQNVSEFRTSLKLETVTPLYGSISDFLRSVNTEYLKIWLKNIEEYSRLLP